MSATHIVHPAQQTRPRDTNKPDRTDIHRELAIAAMLFLAVLIAETAFIFAAAQYIPAASLIFAPVT
jgi:hypothetical protein